MIGSLRMCFVVLVVRHTRLGVHMQAMCRSAEDQPVVTHQWKSTHEVARHAMHVRCDPTLEGREADRQRLWY